MLKHTVSPRRNNVSPIRYQTFETALAPGHKLTRPQYSSGVASYALILLVNLACTSTHSETGDGQAAGTDAAGGQSGAAQSGGPSGGTAGAPNDKATTAGSAGNPSESGGTGGDAGSGTGAATGGDAGSGGAEPDNQGGSGAEDANGGQSAGTSGAETSDAGGSGDAASDDGSSGTGGLGNGVNTTDVVTRTDSSFTFQHFPIETNADNVWNGPASQTAEATTTTFDTVVLENGYLRVTLLPDYGGRVLSIVHKPTDTELLYQNPMGTPYLMFEGIFYYDYLVIMGGIFPSFPEPEHGRYWNQPYAVEIVAESEQAVTVRMSRQDDVDIADGVPEPYDVGRTDVLVELDVTLRAGSTSLELNTKLTNTRDSVVPEFEYWTVTTLAPGSTPGETSIPLNTRILAQMDQVHLLESSWSWFGDAEQRVDGEVFIWDNLSYFENWVDQGTGFANPEYAANWSGLVNYDNDMGVVRVSDNVQTPGLKLWTFGRQSLDIDLADSDEWLRPTIEMWHGVTPEFWDRATLAAGEIREWTDHYVPTLGLREVTAASHAGAVHLSYSENGADLELNAIATLTVPEQTVTAILRLGGDVVAEEDIVVDTTEATKVGTTVASSDVSPGTTFEVEFLLDGDSLLTAQIPLP